MPNRSVVRPRIRRLPTLPLMRRDVFDNPRSEIGQLLLAHAADQAQCLRSHRPGAGQLAERRVVENNEGGDAALGGNVAAQTAQALVQLLVDVAPTGLFALSPCRFGFFRLQQLDRSGRARLPMKRR